MTVKDVESANKLRGLKLLANLGHLNKLTAASSPANPCCDPNHSATEEEVSVSIITNSMRVDRFFTLFTYSFQIRNIEELFKSGQKINRETFETARYIAGFLQHKFEDLIG